MKRLEDGLRLLHGRDAELRALRPWGADPATTRHLGQCEFVGETDAAMLRVLLKVTDKGDYDWVECGGCEAGWQVPHFAESAG
jgi:hypothetical protein